jgi:hypothetical protein
MGILPWRCREWSDLAGTIDVQNTKATAPIPWSTDELPAINARVGFRIELMAAQPAQEMSQRKIG